MLKIKKLILREVEAMPEQPGRLRSTRYSFLNFTEIRFLLFYFDCSRKREIVFLINPLKNTIFTTTIGKVSLICYL